MEENQVFDNDFRDGGAVMSLSNEDRKNLELTAYWAKFLGIVGYVMVGFIVLADVLIFLNIESISNSINNPLMSGPTGMLLFAVFLYFGIAILGYFLARYTYNMGVKLKSALSNNSDSDLSEGFLNLKSLFRTYGILTAIFIGFYVLLLVLVFLGAGAAFFLR